LTVQKVKITFSNNPYLGVVAGRTVGHAASFEVVAAVHTLPTLGVQGSWSYRYVQECTYIHMNSNSAAVKNEPSFWVNQRPLYNFCPFQI
jgi:hypothetical protein